MFDSMEKATANIPEQRKASLYSELTEYRNCTSAMLNKPDKEIDFLELARTGYANMYAIAQDFPEVRELFDWELKVRPEVKTYSWLSEDRVWYSWSYEKMLHYKKTFDESKTWEAYEKFAKKLPNYTSPLTVDFIGPFGGFGSWPYNSCAYLSFAYHTKQWYKGIIQKIDNLLK